MYRINVSGSPYHEYNKRVAVLWAMSLEPFMTAKDAGDAIYTRNYRSIEEFGDGIEPLPKWDDDKSDHENCDAIDAYFSGVARRIAEHGYEDGNGVRYSVVEED